MTTHPSHDETTPLGSDRRLIEEARRQARPEPKEPLPKSIGPYEIIQSLGEGGMGVVYLAEQTKPIHRRVAIKLVKPGMDSRQVLARFETEREALALMNHPHVARVLDAGTTDKGQPYFVMEYVDGVTITSYCDRVRLNTEDRLRLFSQVCKAVQHAHQKGVIHRDIKPSNVLVTIVDDQPAVKVIDFGIAKATQHRLTEETIFTEVGQLIGTPAYMSPEQADPGIVDIDTRTDVYSLGVLLYELLVGAPPFDPRMLRHAAMSEVQRILRDVEPPKPSTRLMAMGETQGTVAELRQTTSHGLARQLRGELDWIIMKCLEKDRARRYDTVSGLDAELQHLLNNEPVLAGPPSAAYRFRKFVRRNKVPVAAAMSIMAALTIGLTIAVAMYFQAERARAETVIERDRANQEARTSKEVTDFLVGIFKISHPNESRGNSVTAREILDEGARRIGSELADQSVVQSALRMTIGRVYQGLGLYEAARSHFEAALLLQEAQFGRESNTVAESLNSLGQVHSQQGDLEAAERYLNEALTIRRGLFGEKHTDVADTLNDLAFLYDARGDYPRSQSLCRQSLAIYRQLLGDDDLATADAIGNLGQALDGVGNASPEALALLREALDIHRKRLGDDHPRTLIRLNNLALAWRARGNLAEAEPAAREVLESGRKVLGEDHPDVAIWMANYAGILQDQRRYAEAEPLFRESLETYRKRIGDDHPNMVMFINNLAVILAKQEKYAEAEPLVREVVVQLQNIFGAEHAHTLTGKTTLVRVLLAQKEYADAEPVVRTLLEARRKTLPADHADLATLVCHLGIILDKLDSCLEAEPLLRECLEFRRKTSSPDSIELARSMAPLGRCLTQLGRLAEAETLLVDAAKNLARHSDAPVDLRGQAASALVSLYEAWDSAEPGKGYAEKAAEWREALDALPASSTETAPP